MNQLPEYLQAAFAGFNNNDPRYINLCRPIDQREPTQSNAFPWEELTEPERIVVLLAADRKIGKLGPQIGQLRSLKHLDLSQNPLKVLPKEMGQLSELEYLRVSETVEIDPMAYLELLFQGPQHYPNFLSDAGLRDLPAELAQLQSLRSLQLDGNRFEQIPEAIFELQNLLSLDLSANLLKSVSPKIAQLKSLQYLKLSRNNFQELPESIGELKQLKRLRLDSLHLKTLPESIGEMTNLEMLEICQGKIEQIPLSIQHLPNLKYIYLVDTLVDDIDVNMLKVLLPNTQICFEAGF